MVHWVNEGDGGAATFAGTFVSRRRIVNGGACAPRSHEWSRRPLSARRAMRSNTASHMQSNCSTSGAMQSEYCNTNITCMHFPTKHDESTSYFELRWRLQWAGYKCLPFSIRTLWWAYFTKTLNYKSWMQFQNFRNSMGNWTENFVEDTLQENGTKNRSYNIDLGSVRKCKLTILY